MEKHDQLISELTKLINGGSAHASFDHAIEGLTLKQVSQKVAQLPYTIWQLVEHIRIAQWDMLEFSKAEDHKSPKWPDDYWSKEDAPADEKVWTNSLKQIKENREEFVNFLKKADLYEAIPKGEGQTVLREAIQIADHNSYHTAEIIMMRRLLGAWK